MMMSAMRPSRPVWVGRLSDKSKISNKKGGPLRPPCETAVFVDAYVRRRGRNGKGRLEGSGEITSRPKLGIGRPGGDLRGGRSASPSTDSNVPMSVAQAKRVIAYRYGKRLPNILDAAHRVSYLQSVRRR